MSSENACYALEPTFAERVWGRKSLEPWYTVEGGQPVGEAWLTGPDCTVADGERRGEKFGDFPLLIKMLFAEEKLSVQVHPDDAQAQRLGLSRGKTECWYVLEAKPGAMVACGLQPGVSLATLAQAIDDGTAEDLLRWLSVSVGDMVFVDAGTVHAVGPELVILEVQQTCDVTYRLYDYGRPRELHLHEGLAVVKTHTAAGKVTPRPFRDFLRLVESEYFVVDRFDLPAGTTMEVDFRGAGCMVSISGRGRLGDKELPLAHAVICTIGSCVVTTELGVTFLRCCEPAR